jgi:hypothetical protein
MGEPRQETVWWIQPRRAEHLRRRFGAGKSLFLQNLAVNWAQAGLNVCYISFELSEALTAMRLDAMMTNIPTRSVMKQLDDVEIKVKMLAKKSGNLQIKYLPSGSNVLDIKDISQRTRT